MFIVIIAAAELEHEANSTNAVAEGWLYLVLPSL